MDDDEDTLQALAFALELEMQHEIEDAMLRADPDYPIFLDQLQLEHEHELG